MVAHQRFLCRLPFVVGGVQSKRPHGTSRAAAESPRSSNPGLREKVWTAVFGVSYRVAGAEQLRAGVSRQWLSVGQRARLSHLAESELLSHHISYNSELAPGEHEQFGRRLDSRWWTGFDTRRRHSATERLRPLRYGSLVGRHALQKYLLRSFAVFGPERFVAL